MKKHHEGIDNIAPQKMIDYPLFLPKNLKQKNTKAPVFSSNCSL